jgi:chromate transport protein ChrA
MVIVAWQVFRGDGKGSMGWSTLLIAGLSLVALLLKLPPPLVLLGAGILGIFLFR